MIQLGSMVVARPSVAFEARRRVLELVRELGGDEVLASVTAATLSDLSRWVMVRVPEPRLEVSLAERLHGVELQFEVVSDQHLDRADWAQAPGGLRRRCTLAPDGSRVRMACLMESSRLGSGQLEVLREIIGRQTRDQLLDSLQVKNEALAVASEKANEAARTKADFLANMSHEIRTPMNAILGMCHLTLKTELAPRQRDYLRKIEASGRHLLGIINDILDFSKIEAGKLSLESVEFSLDEVLETVSNLIAHKCVAKGLELVFDVDRHVPRRLVGDPTRIGQVLINYGNNAVKFTERGEIAVQVRVESETEDSVRLLFSVRDTGIGLSAEQAGRLFQSFQQADTSTTRKYGGTGLGLAISRSIAALMDGEVGVESEPGEGATFWFTARLGRPSGDWRESGILASDLRGLPVLVVDDNENARIVLRGMLEDLGLWVNDVASGAEALERVAAGDAHARPYAIVFLDWQMPGLDGVETGRRIAALELHQPPRLVMVTGFGRDDVIQEARTAGIQSVLVKPLNASMVFECVARELNDSPVVRVDDRIDADDPLASLAPIAGARVLLVEDNDLNQEVATALLGEAGLVVDVAENGLVALDRVRQAQYDIVLMDMQMPVMDGLTATREIRRMPGFAQLPIVAMTANVMAGDRERCEAAGMNGHVGKPIEPAELCSALLQWVTPRTVPALTVTSAPHPAVVAPSDASADDTARALAAVEGLDVEGAMRRLMGKTALYHSTLRKFSAGQRDFVRQVSAALDEGRRHDAERHAHTLKGAAGNIGALGLSGQAASLEALLRGEAGRGDLERPLATVGDTLGELLKALDGIFPPELTSAVSADPAAVAGVCERLEAHLRESDPEAFEMFQAHAGLLAAAFPSRFAAMQEAVDGFDVEGLLEELRAARA